MFWPPKVKKKHPQKLLRIPQIHFFSLTALTAQTAQTQEFMFQNVAYWPTVYRTGDLPNIKAVGGHLFRSWHRFAKTSTEIPDPNECPWTIIGVSLASFLKLEWAIKETFFSSCAHCLGMNYYVNFLGGLGSNGFNIKWRFGSLKSQNPGDRFGATS